MTVIMYRFCYINSSSFLHPLLLVGLVDLLVAILALLKSMAKFSLTSIGQDFTYYFCCRKPTFTMFIMIKH